MQDSHDRASSLLHQAYWQCCAVLSVHGVSWLAARVQKKLTTAVTFSSKTKYQH